METKEIVENLLKNSNVSVVKDAVIRNVTVTPKDNYVRLGITLNKPVKTMIPSESDPNTLVEGETNIIFISTFAIASLLKDDDDAAFAVNHLLKHPDAFSVILSRATIDILQEKVTKGDEYKNLFAEDAKPATFTNDIFINNVIKIKLSSFSIRFLDKIADKLLATA